MDSTEKSNSVGWRFENTYSRLPQVLFTPTAPARVHAPRLSILNHSLAEQLGLQLHSLSPQAAARLFTGQYLPEGSQPIAQAYAGHQYGGFTMLGDGRAILLGEHRTPSGCLVDVQFKGSGPTAYSRRGDGLAAYGPMLREYVISEAMFALGIPTTRSLAVVTTGESIVRATESRGAVLTRVAASHIRVGSFQYLAARRDESSLRLLADYTIERHDPELAQAPEKYLEFLRAVIHRQAALIARWQLVGFIHGVMNTDNMAVSGETIDYGPCAFMNAYDPETVFSSIDHGGRYAYGNQPVIAQWNLARLAETLLPLLDANTEKAVAQATEALHEFPEVFERHWLAGMRRKLGLEGEEAGDAELIQSFLDWMQSSRADFTNTFRDLSSEYPLHCVLDQDPGFQNWRARWQLRLLQGRRPLEVAYAAMRQVNPAVIPRNHRVEEALAAAENHDDLSVLQRLLTVLKTPYEVSTGAELYRDPPDDDSHYRTFCGT